VYLTYSRSQHSRTHFSTASYASLRQLRSSTTRPSCCTLNSSQHPTFRKITPNQHALFLEHISAITLHILTVSPDAVQSQFDHFYSFAIDLLHQFYPLRTITVTFRDPDLIMPAIKAKLRRKNCLMRQSIKYNQSKLFVTHAMSCTSSNLTCRGGERIGKNIVQHNRSRLSKLQGKVHLEGCV